MVNLRYFLIVKQPLLSFLFTIVMTQVLFAASIPVATLGDLQDVRNNLNGEYHLIGNIDASEVKTWNGGLGFVPIGSPSTPFTGIFKGNGYTISHLYINTPDINNAALFGSLNGGTVTGLTIESAEIYGRYSTGALAGYAVYGAYVSDCSVENSTISGYETVGGLIGGSRGATIQKSSVVSSTVNATNANAGGILGQLFMNSTLNESFVEGTKVTTRYRAGGLIGSASYGNGVSVANCYVREGTVIAEKGAGGLMGYNEDLVQNCYVQATVASHVLPEADTLLVGGLVGHSRESAQYIGVLWDYTYANLDKHHDATYLGVILDLSGAEGETAVTLQQKSTYETQGWDFSATWIMNTQPALRSAEPLVSVYTGQFDFNNDGMFDIVWTNTATQMVYVLQRGIPGNSLSPSLSLRGSIALPLLENEVARPIADVDGDGSDDIIIKDESNNSIRLVLMDQNGIKAEGNYTLLQSQFTLDITRIESFPWLAEYVHTVLDIQANHHALWKEGPEAPSTVALALKEDTMVGYQISENADFSGADWKAYSDLIVFDLSEGYGIKTLYVQFRDELSNIVIAEPQRVSIHEVPATITITDPVDGYATHNSDVTISGTSSAPALTINTDGSMALESSEAFFTVIPLATENNSVSVEALDLNGNFIKSASIEVLYDTTPPVNPSITIAQGEVTQTRMIMLNPRVENGSEMQIAVSPDFAGAVWESYVSMKAYTLPDAQATHTVYVRYRDAAKNVSDVTFAHIIYDSISPVVTITSPVLNEKLSTETITVSGVVNELCSQVMVNGESAILRDTLFLGDSERSTSYTVQLNAVPEGIAVPIAVTATDRAGNSNTPTEITIQVDRSIPEFTLSNPPSAIYTSERQIQVSGTLSETATVYSNGLSYGVFSGNYSITVPLVSGENSIEMWVVDLYGNTSISSSIQVTSEESYFSTAQANNERGIRWIKRGGERFRSDRPTVIFSHGAGGAPQGRNTYWDQGRFQGWNIAVFNWSGNVNYPKNVYEDHAKNVAQYFNTLIDRSDYDNQELRFVGYSWGLHLVSYAARKTLTHIRTTDRSILVPVDLLDPVLMAGYWKDDEGAGRWGRDHVRHNLGYIANNQVTGLRSGKKLITVLIERYFLWEDLLGKNGIFDHIKDHAEIYQHGIWHNDFANDVSPPGVYVRCEWQNYDALKYDKNNSYTTNPIVLNYKHVGIFDYRYYRDGAILANEWADVVHTHWSWHNRVHDCWRFVKVTKDMGHYEMVQVGTNRIKWGGYVSKTARPNRKWWQSRYIYRWVDNYKNVPIYGLRWKSVWWEIEELQKFSNEIACGHSWWPHQEWRGVGGTIHCGHSWLPHQEWQNRVWSGVQSAYY